MKYTKAEREESIAKLKEWLRPGDRVFTKLQHVSSSGMSRSIQVLQPNIDERDGKQWVWFAYLGYHAARALEWSYDEKKEGVRVSGCGMDMGFHLVYSLAWVLFEDGYALKQEWI